MDPVRSLNAIVSPSGITLGQLALLQLIDSPLYCGTSKIPQELAPGLMLFGLETDQAIALVMSGNLPALSDAWLEEIGKEQFEALLDAISLQISRFWSMLPAPDPEAEQKPGNGLIAELAEWYSRTYHLPPGQVIWKEPAVRVALFFRCWSQSVYRYMTKPVINDNEQLNRIAYNAAQKIVGEENIGHLPTMMGSEDFSTLAKGIPYFFAFIGTRNAEKNITYTNHHEKFTVDESVLKNGAGVMAQFAADYLAES